MVKWDMIKQTMLKLLVIQWTMIVIVAQWSQKHNHTPMS